MYELVSSDAVLDELSSGDYATRQQVLSLAAELPLLPMDPAVAGIVEAYVEHMVMPQHPLGMRCSSPWRLTTSYADRGIDDLVRSAREAPVLQDLRSGSQYGDNLQ